MIKKDLRTLFDAMYHGKYSFDDFLNSPISENYEVVAHPANKKPLLKPRENLKKYHRFLNLFLIENLPINERVVFSYRRGASAFDAVKKHREGRYFFHTDIRSFFDSIDAGMVRQTILSGEDSCAILDLHESIERIVDLICVNGSVPVGFPTSAPLSNAVLLNFDNYLEKTCDNLGLVYSRYADDIIISGSDRENISNIDETVQSGLYEFASKNLIINRRKTRFFQVGGKVKILGMLILPNQKIIPDSKKTKELEFLLHFYLSDRSKFDRIIDEMRAKKGKRSETLEGMGEDLLSGNLNYVDSIDPEYTNKLRRKFGAATIDMLIHKGFSDKK